MKKEKFEKVMTEQKFKLGNGELYIKNIGNRRLQINLDKYNINFYLTEFGRISYALNPMNKELLVALIDLFERALSWNEMSYHSLALRYKHFSHLMRERGFYRSSAPGRNTLLDEIFIHVTNLNSYFFSLPQSKIFAIIDNFDVFHEFVKTKDKYIGERWRFSPTTKSSIYEPKYIEILYIYEGKNKCIRLKRHQPTSGLTAKEVTMEFEVEFREYALNVLDMFLRERTGKRFDIIENDIMKGLN